MSNNDGHYGTVVIELSNDEYFVTEVVKDGDKFITGTFTNTGLLRDEWEVTISDYANEQEALEELLLKRWRNTHNELQYNKGMYKVTAFSTWVKPQEFLFDTLDEATECCQELRDQQYKVVIDEEEDDYNYVGSPITTEKGTPIQY